MRGRRTEDVELKRARGDGTVPVSIDSNRSLSIKVTRKRSCWPGKWAEFLIGKRDALGRKAKNKTER